MDYQLLFTKAKEAGIEDIELYVTNSNNFSMQMIQGKVSSNKVNKTTAYSARAIFDGKMSYVQFEDENENVDGLVTTLVNNAKLISSTDENFIYSGDDKYEELNIETEDYSKIPYNDKVKLMSDAVEKILKYDNRIFLVPLVEYEEVEMTIEIVNSKGLNLKGKESVIYLYGYIISKQGEETKTDYFQKGVRKFNDFDIDKLTSEACERAVNKLGGEPCLSGEYPLIIDHLAMGDILSSFMPMFTGDAAMKNLTVLADKENAKIMSDLIDLVEEPLNTNALSQRTFDDEGVACYNKYIVEKGVFKGFIHNLKTAKRYNTKSTGNGYKSGGTVGVDVCNAYIKPGKYSREDLVKSIDKGLLITDVGGLHAGVNPISGDFNIQSSGFMIENGKVTQPVTLIVLSGNFLKVMSEVEMVANDHEFELSNVSAPSIKFTKVKVSGK